MASIKLYVVGLSLVAVLTAFACDLKSSQSVIEQRIAVQTYIDEHKPSIVTTYRQYYHVTPPVGWMNDPNGLSYFKGNYHLFYQFYPYDIKTGPIHWGHVTSKDLVTWNQEPVALIPEQETIFSGSAIVKDGTLVLIYTAHTSLDSENFTETQYFAFSNDGVVFDKYKNNPVIASSQTGSKDFRDPKIWKHGNYYYVVLGSRTSSNLGTVLLYRSLDLGTWEYFSTLGESTGDLGYMWECPDFFELDGKYILLMSPQGMDPVGDRYKNQDQTGYIIGNFNYETGAFVKEYDFQEIDYGHDIYATQTLGKDNRRHLIAWMAQWNANFTESEDGWAGSMTIFRELTLKGSRILMNPVDSITNLRDTVKHNGTLVTDASILSLNKTGELIISGNWTQDISLDIKGADDTENLITLEWVAANSMVRLNRAGEVRQGPWTPDDSHSWRVFLDASSIEVFCGDGDVVFSSRAYPKGFWRVTNKSEQTLNIVAYSLKRSVPE